MVTQTTSLLHDIEEYFANNNFGPGVYARLDPTGLLKRAHEQLVVLEDDLYDAKKEVASLQPEGRCDCWRMLDDNDDS